MFVKQQEGGMLSRASILSISLDRLALVALTEHRLQHTETSKIPALALDTVCPDYELI